MIDENNLNDDLKDKGRFTEEANKTASEFKQSANETFNSNPGENKKVLAGVLAIVLGGLGVHKFILGYNKEGIILLSITLIGIVTTCLIIGVFILWIAPIIGLIEGIIYLTKSDAEFYQTYQIGKKPWF